jgi:EAL domain-containing protein (putative c-di-GMP-specific phosphodiesterase class I)
MYRAKARGRARYELFDEEMRERVSDRLRTEIALRRAVIDGGLEVHYQPLVSLEDGAIVGAEALLRWHDEERGWVPPVEFIPVAEDSGLIVPMGTWVLEQACREALAWAPGADGGPLEIAVNLSSRQVAQPEFGAEVERVVAETGIDPARLTFEITESVVMEEAEAPMESIRRIEDLGVKLALDDFGTGYSSLSYLDRLPIDILKLDRSFIAALAGMRGSPTSAIVAGVVTMAKALGLVVVAEGVEEPDQVQELRRLGCAFAQGFLFSPAVPAAEFRTLLGTAFDVDEPAATGT